MKLSLRWIAVLRRLLLGLACLVTLVALVIVVENWRGDRAWAAVERDLRARGEPLDLAAFQPRPVPDDQNFFKAPLLARILYQRKDDPARQQVLDQSRLSDFEPLTRFGGKPGDFAAMRDALRKNRFVSVPATGSAAGDVVAALAPLRALFDDLRDATKSRPLAAFEPRDHPFDPPQLAVDTLYRVAQLLGIRAAAEVELGHSDEAHTDIVTLQRFANEFAAPPATLLTVLVGAAIHGIAGHAIASGIEHRAWNAPQLAEFQSRYARFEPIARFANAIRCERAAVLHLLDTRPKLVAGDFQFPPWLFFHGWAQQNKVEYCRRLDAEVLSAISTAPERVLPERLVRPAPGVRPTISRHPYDRTANFALNNVSKILEGYANTSEQLRLNSIAWAIERHRLAHGRAPEKLAELVPAFLAALPIGILDGEPLRYHLQPDGRFQLYALGKNRTDDAGQADDIALR